MIAILRTIGGIINVLQSILWSIIYLWTVYIGFKVGSVIGAAICIFFPFIPSYYFAWKDLRFEQGSLYYSTFTEAVGVATILGITALIIIGLLASIENRSTQ